ncbi:MAG: FKBP-type peptidyl-prolyl cis-trans isomerase [Tannerellaceae bacterium]|nr:FKBP-type peptidyl-prolyl cis-trans isomerase [Tannerellaceae bacterium]
MMDWVTALQYMKEGDEWEIWIPQELAYGRRGSDFGSVTIPPYSALNFTLKVLEVKRIQ